MFNSNKSILRHIMYKLIASNRLPISEAKNKAKQKLFGRGTWLFTYLDEAI